MTNEEIERAIEFVVKQQPQFAAGLQRVVENQAQMSQLQTQLANVMVELIAAQTRTENGITERQTRNEERFAALADSIAHTDQKLRTLTNLYNQRPTWLDLAHRALDMAVAAAYGWPADLTPGEILGRLLTLNQQRAQPEPAAS